MNANIEMTGKELRDSATAIILNGKEYHLEFDMNALCDMEERYGSFDKAMDAMQGADNNAAVMSDLRFMMWKALQHSEPDMTEQEAGRLITFRNLNEVMNAVKDAMRVAQPEVDEKNAKNPQKEQASRG